MMKRILIFTFVLLMSLSLSAQDNTIRLTVSGEGATKEEATANALRSAIEQAFGTFVSANTQILNDDIVKDEIATISSGNIQEYTELGCITMPDGSKSVSLSATVSIGNLISYAKSKGSSIEFAGQVFAMNIKMRELNKINEEKALSNLLQNLCILSDNLFNYKLAHGTPYRRSSNNGEVWNCNVQLSLEATNASAQFYKLLFDTLEALSLSDIDRSSYKETHEPFYGLIIADLPSYYPGLTGYSVHKKARSFWMRNDCEEFSKKLYDIICNAIYTFSIELDGINERYTTSVNYNEYANNILYFTDNDNVNIVKGKDLGWKSYNFYLIPELAEKNVIRTTSSGVLPGLWYRPSFECKLDEGAKESTACIIEGYEQYQHTGEVILTLAFDIPILGTDQLYNMRKITIDRMFRNQQQAEQIIVPKFSESKSSIDQEIDESSAPSTHNYEVAQKEDETKISTIKTEPVADNTPIPFQLVEEKPSFQGGDINQFLKWVRENQIYPEIAKENGIQGRVTVRATINTDGSLTDIMVVRGVDPSLDKEAIRVVSQSPKWKPGKQGGKAVPVTYNFPVTFQIR